MKYYKIVLMPIQVCLGHYCCGYGRVCGHFDNEGGHPTCSIKLGYLKYDSAGNVLKPDRCKKLMEKERTP